MSKSSKYSQKRFDQAKHSGTGALETASKRAIQKKKKKQQKEQFTQKKKKKKKKTAEGTVYLIGDKIPDKIKSLKNITTESFRNS